MDIHMDPVAFLVDTYEAGLLAFAILLFTHMDHFVIGVAQVYDPRHRGFATLAYTTILFSWLLWPVTVVLTIRKLAGR